MTWLRVHRLTVALAALAVVVSSLVLVAHARRAAVVPPRRAVAMPTPTVPLSATSMPTPTPWASPLPAGPPPRRATIPRGQPALPAVPPAAPPNPAPLPPAAPPPPHPPTATPAPAPTATATALPPDVGTVVPTATTGPTQTPGPTLTPTPLPPPPTPIRPLGEDTSLMGGSGPPGPLSGLPTDPARLDLRPVAVSIDNYSPSARPQTGLGAASLVYETLAEGGITRYLAVFLERQPAIVGPVRSTRIYFNGWADGLNAILVHAGGNSDAMAQIGALHGVLFVDELSPDIYRWQATGPLFFWRSADRVMPHNLYTSVAAVRAQATLHHFAVHGHFPARYPHKSGPPAAGPAVSWLTLGFSGGAYDASYRYDAATNRYKRFVGGAPDVDAATGRQLAPHNIAVLFCQVRPDWSSDTSGSVIVETTGSGPALLFQDGRLVHGSWRRDGIGGVLRLLNANGMDWQLTPGQTWIEAVPQGNPVRWDGL